MTKKDKIEILPGLESGDIPVDQAMKINEVNAADHFDLKPGTSLEETSIYWTALEFIDKEGDFERNEHVLRHHFINILNLIASRLKLQKENFQLALGRETMGPDLSWSDINKLFNELIKTVMQSSDYEEKITRMFGFPEGTFEKIQDCIEAAAKWEEEENDKITKL